MTQDKELLLKDLCGRVPYRVKCKYDDRLIVNTLSVDFFWEKIEGYERYVNCTRKYDIENIKPYLFPLSSMTEEQKKEQEAHFTCIKHDMSFSICRYMEWCYKNHLDINGLLSKGLAIDATGLNIY